VAVSSSEEQPEQPVVPSEPAADAHRERALTRTLLLIALVTAVIGSLGAPLITSVATTLHISLDAAQWTLTIALLAGAVATPVLGRLGTGRRRRPVVLGTLVVVAAGSLLTVLPLPLGVLLAGRAAQGCGLAVTPLMMAAAREHLGVRRGPEVIAMISVVSAAGVGVGYPLAGYLTDLAGVRAAYAAGLALTAAALIVAVRSFPRSAEQAAPRPDLAASLLLTAGLFALLLALGEISLWEHHLLIAVGLVVLAGVLLAGWALRERGLTWPVIDLRLLRHPAVAGANVTMLVVGAGIYMLLTLVTRYVQTPAAVGYGFGLDTFTAGLFLVPFSLFSFIAGRLSLPLRRHMSAAALLSAATFVVLAALVVFATTPANLAGPVVAMSLLGLSLGGFLTAMPAVILQVTPQHETASAMGVNQVMRSTGFSLGSTLTGLVLAAYTPAGAVFPSSQGYRAAAWTGCAVTALALVIVLLTLNQRRLRPPPVDVSGDPGQTVAVDNPLDVIED
jgi:MFS family permease